MVGIFAVVLLVLIGWGISVLYKATSVQPKEKPVVSQPAATTENVSTNKNESAKNAATSTNKNTATKKTAKAADASTATPNKLKASGIDVPALYID